MIECEQPNSNVEIFLFYSLLLIIDTEAVSIEEIYLYRGSVMGRGTKAFSIRMINMNIKHVIKETLKGFSKFISYKVLFPAVYICNRRKPVKEGYVLFVDNQDRPIPDNFIPLLKKCKQNAYQCEIISGSAFKQHRDTGLSISKIRYYISLIKKLAIAHVVFESDYYPLFDSVPLRKETQIVQLWHACGLGKKWGYAVESKEWGDSNWTKRLYPMYFNQSFVSVSSDDPILRAGYSQAFHCKEKAVLPLGVPRTDIYFDQDYCDHTRRKIRELIADLGDRKVILFAPTFRGKTLTEASYSFPLDLNQMAEALKDDYIFLVKLHPMTAEYITEAMVKPGFSYNITHEMSAEQAICAADILITDYSSILFEYLLFERPIISYVPDLEKYESDRGLFLPYTEMAPGPYVTTQEELIQKLKTVEAWFDPSRIQQYKDRFMSACDGHSTERIYNKVFG